MDPTTPAQSTELTPRNGSTEPPPITCDEAALSPVLLVIIIALVGLVGNAGVLRLLGFRMRRNAFSVYILNLAAADFLFLCFLIINVLKKRTSTFSLMSSVLTSVMHFSYLAGLSTLSAISAERCLSVLWPIWYRCRRPRHTSAVVCALLWALSVLLSTLEGYFCAVPYLIGDHTWCRTVDFIIGAWLIYLFVVLCGSSLALLCRFLCGSRRMHLTRLYVTMLLTVLVFLLCGLPFGIKWFLLFWIQNDVIFLCHLHLVSVVLSSVNSSANPIIYFFVGSFRQHQYGRTLKQVLQRALQDTPEVEERGGSLPRGSLEISESRLEQ
ncbi:mas-related G-protein coupled receptor member X1 [Daubentonia madagascariensis]|uniref:Mas-related G-protein coupled receptor member X1 n=1 Tax=Daubentonia madagascariensis TaxID=31869 RepID=A0ABD2FCX9_DAUMA